MVIARLAERRNFFAIQCSKILGLVLLLVLFISIFNVVFVVKVAGAANLPTTSQKEASSGQQWPTGLWQAYQSVHPHTSSGAYIQSSELTATDNAAGDQFGTGVSVSGDGNTAIIGAYNHSVSGNSSAGAAYIFTKSGNTWNQTNELTASDLVAGDYFGTAVSLSYDGNTALIGAVRHAVGGNSGAGAAYIFTRSSGTWNQAAELTASDAAGVGDFGNSVSLSSDGATALIGAPVHNTIGASIGAGAAYIFTKGGSGWVNSTQTAELTASDGVSHDSFGEAVAISGDGTTALVGANDRTVGGNSYAGAAYIFTKGGSGWVNTTQTAELTASDSAKGDQLGSAVSLSSDGATALISARGHIVSSNNSTGEAYIFTKGGSGWSNGQETTKFTASDSSLYGYFGYSVSLSSDGTTALIGTLYHQVTGNSGIGVAYIFNNNGSTWNQVSELAASDSTPEDSFGCSVSLSSDGSIALVGANQHQFGSSTYAGASYVFKSRPATSTTVNSSPNPSVYGQPITFTANVTPITVTGSVTFNLDNNSVYTATLNGITGVATYVTNTLSSGIYTATATYNGDINDAPSTSSVLTQTVNPTNSVTSLTSAPNPSLISQTVTFTATVSGTGPTPPSGTVTFTNATTNQTLGTATLANGVATTTAVFSSTGTYTVTASYGGDNNYTGSNNSATQQVVSLPPTIAAKAGNGQSTPISTTFPVALQAIVRDGNTGSPLPGVTVVFQAPTSGASGTFSPTNSTTFTATTDANGVATANTFTANGTVGSYQVTASTAGAASPATFNLVNNPANTASGYTYYLPFLANAANNFTTYLVFQNTANVSSTVSISFYDNNGNAVAASGTCTSVAALGECIVPNPFASGKQGEGIIVSQQPLNVIVSEATPYGGSAYAVTAGASNNLIAPVAIKGGLVDFTTQLSIFNGGNASVAGTVQFFDQNGNHIAVADKSFTLAAHSTTIYDQSQDNTLNGFYGWAQISSPAGSQLVAQTLEQRPSVKFVAIVNAQFNPQTTLYAPAIFNQAFGNFVTGANLVNPNSQPVTVTITYYKNDGTASTTTPFVIPGNAVTGIFQGANSGNGLPSGGLPSGWYGAATVKVTGGSGIIMFVNEQGGLTATGSDQSGTYGAAISGSSTVGLPVMANGAFGGYITGATVENITSSPVTATVQYYDLSGNAVGTAKTVVINGNASYGLYQGGSDQALQNGFYGTAQITVTGGPSSSLLVTTNAQSNAFFYSYTEPNF